MLSPLRPRAHPQLARAARAAASPCAAALTPARRRAAAQRVARWARDGLIAGEVWAAPPFRMPRQAQPRRAQPWEPAAAVCFACAAPVPARRRPEWAMAQKQLRRCASAADAARAAASPRPWSTAHGTGERRRASKCPAAASCSHRPTMRYNSARSGSWCRIMSGRGRGRGGAAKDEAKEAAKEAPLKRKAGLFAKERACTQLTHAHVRESNAAHCCAALSLATRCSKRLRQPYGMMTALRSPAPVVPTMMYGFGDAEKPMAETVALVEARS